MWSTGIVWGFAFLSGLIYIIWCIWSLVYWLRCCSWIIALLEEQKSLTFWLQGNQMFYLWSKMNVTLTCKPASHILSNTEGWRSITIFWNWCYALVSVPIKDCWLLVFLIVQSRFSLQTHWRLVQHTSMWRFMHSGTCIHVQLPCIERLPSIKRPVFIVPVFRSYMYL